MKRCASPAGTSGSRKARMTMVVIEDMEMPKSCKECGLKDGASYCSLIGEYCDWLAAWAAQCRPLRCPLIDLSDDGK